MRRDFLALLDDEVGSLAHDDAGKPHRARGMRAAALFDDVGVALEDVHVVERHPEPFRDALRESCFVALSARQRADDDINTALRVHGDVGALARIAAGRFKVTAKSDAAQKLEIKSKDGAIKTIDARPSDSIAMAVRLKAPIFVADDVFQKSSLAQP